MPRVLYKTLAKGFNKSIGLILLLCDHNLKVLVQSEVKVQVTYTLSSSDSEKSLLLPSKYWEGGLEIYGSAFPSHKKSTVINSV